MVEPHGFELACPQGIFILVIDQDKITFRENPRVDGPIILTLDTLFVSLVGQGCISMLAHRVARDIKYALQVV
jgi:hypothetical protein